MGKIAKPEPEKLVIGFLYSDPGVYAAAKKILAGRFGPNDFESEELAFNWTSYYREEMGDALKRRFISFKKPVDPGRLADIKIYTNRVEGKFLYPDTKKRGINIDPGLLSLSGFVLATTKNFAHRVYIGKGIYAEITLRYKSGRFTTHEWTYPDYASAEYGVILNKIRDLYKEQMKKTSKKLSKSVV
jgi:hypothetical protein